MSVQFDAVADILFRSASVPGRQPVSVMVIGRLDGDDNSAGPIFQRFGDASGTTFGALYASTIGAVQGINALTQSGAGTLQASTVHTVPLNVFRHMGYKRVSNLTTAYYFPSDAAMATVTVSQSDVADTSASFAIGSNGVNGTKLTIAALHIYDADVSDADFQAQVGHIAAVRTANLWASYLFTASGTLTTDSSGNTRTLTSGGTPTFVAGPLFGELGATLGALTTAATGTLKLQGVTNTTLGTLLAAGTGSSVRDAALAVTLGALTTAATGTVTLQGSAAVTLGALTMVGTGTLAVAAAVDVTLGALTVAADGALFIDGAADITLGEMLAAGTGSSVRDAALAVTLGELTTAATGTVKLQGSLGVALGALTVSAAGSAGNTGALAVTLGEMLAAGTGSSVRDGAVSVTLGEMTVSAVGSVGGNLITGQLSATLGELALSGTAQVINRGSADIMLGTMLAAGAAGLQVQGMGVITLGTMTCDAAGMMITGRTASLDVLLGALMLAATATKPPGPDDMSIITVAHVKAYLRITHSYDDALLQQLIDGAEDEALSFLDRPTLPRRGEWCVEDPDSNTFEYLSDSDDLAPSVRMGCYLIVQGMYEGKDPAEMAGVRVVAAQKWFPYRAKLGV